tara:strand:- start:1654 stop:1878 length:225 start_codon:yes stop_codon:yes gene_type:complete
MKQHSLPQPHELLRRATALNTTMKLAQRSGRHLIHDDDGHLWAADTRNPTPELIGSTDNLAAARDHVCEGRTQP